MGFSLRVFFFLSFANFFFGSMCCVFLSISFVIASVFSSIYVPSYVIFLWARVSADDPRDIMRNNGSFSLCRLLSRGTHAGDPRVHEEPSSSKHSSNAIFITSPQPNSLIILA